jgi:7-cyano-7-deazaguanine synthase in queuosine biosynthesis
MLDLRSALVSIAGGQSSTTRLAWPRHRFESIESGALDHRPRHRIEPDQRLVEPADERRRFPAWAKRLVDAPFIDRGVPGQIGDMSLARDRSDRGFQTGKTRA